MSEAEHWDQIDPLDDIIDELERVQAREWRVPMSEITEACRRAAGEIRRLRGLLEAATGE